MDLIDLGFGIIIGIIIGAGGVFYFNKLKRQS